MDLVEERYDPAAWGDTMAAVYDGWAQNLDLPTAATVEVLAELGEAGPVLEFGVGTGRVAIPLAQRGVTVNGIEASHEMIEQLKTKPGGDLISVVRGDFSRVSSGREHTLVFAIFNAIFSVTSQADQVQCFARAARQLRPGGTFVVEASLPPRNVGMPGADFSVHYVGDNGVIVGFAQHDPATQITTARNVWIDGENRIHSALIRGRYASASELDLMARLTSFRLRERWGGWRKEPFTAASASHVSLYELDSDVAADGIRASTGERLLTKPDTASSQSAASGSAPA